MADLYPSQAPAQAEARARVARNIALAAGFAAFALSFPAINAALPRMLMWLAGAGSLSGAPDYGAPALARIAIAAILAAGVGASVFAMAGRGVIFRSERLASPAPRTPAAAALAFALAGVCAYLIMRTAAPAVAPMGRWNDDGSALAMFILVPAAIGFLWRLMGLAAEGAAARRRERTRPDDPFSRRGGV